MLHDCNMYFNRPRFEDELIERIVVPYMQHVDTDPDITIRTVAANLLVDVCLECDTKRCVELLDILEKVTEFVIYVNVCNIFLTNHVFI